jgi:hypothetical protein
MRQDTFFFQDFLDFVNDGIELPGAFSRADNKIVRETA